MPSILHEALVELFRNQPALAPELLRNVFRYDVPSFREAIIGEGDLTTLAPTSYLTDLVVLLRRAEEVLGVIVEVQLAIDKSKPLSWLVYLANLHAKTRAPVVLLVVATDEQVAAWCAGPFFYGHPGHYLRPLVLGPKNVPLVTDEAEAKELPELSLLSALAHSRGSDAFAVGKAALRAAMQLDDDRSRIYTDLILAKSGARAQLLEEVMIFSKDYEYQTPELREIHERGRALGLEKGRAEAKAEALIAVLRARGFVLAGEVIEGIHACRDVPKLDAWITRAAVASSVDEIFANHGS